MKQIIIILISSIAFGLNAQEVKKYYKLPDGQIFTNKTYQHFINSDNIKTQLKFSIKDTIKTQDSLIYIVSIIPLKKVTTEGKTITKKRIIGFNPYAKFDTLIGSRFKIENYKNKNGKKFNKEYLFNKPTIINFWFTRCSPCISELPNLHNVKKALGENVNYLAITFEDVEKVNKFLTKHKFDYFHITNAKKEIDNLKIDSYPLTIVLNKRGVIVNIFPDMYNTEKEVVEKLKKLL